MTETKPLPTGLDLTQGVPLTDIAESSMVTGHAGGEPVLLVHQAGELFGAAEPDDGVRILIDRLWPRGVSKANAALDDWIEGVAPSTALRQWFGHDPMRWTEFQRCYKAELRQHSEELNRIRSLARKRNVTLVYSAHDEEHDDAVVLKEVLLEGTRRGPHHDQEV